MHRLWLLADLVGSNEQTLGAMAIPLDPLYRVLSVLAGISALMLLVFVMPASFMQKDAERPR